MGRVRTDEKRDAILDGARRAFAELGYHAASITEITERAGVARGTFYRYFESKRDALAAVLDHLLVTLWQQVRPIRLGAVEEVRAQVRQNVSAVTELLVREPDLARILFSEAIGIDAELDEKMRQFYRRLLQLVESSLEEGQRRGLVDAEANVTVLAISLVGALKEIIFQTLLGTRRLEPAQVTREIDRLVGSGLGQGKPFTVLGSGSGSER